LHVARRAIDVAREIELKRDRGQAKRAVRGHLRNPGYPAELPLERCCHGGRHNLRASTGKVRGHGNRGEIQLRQRGDGQHAKRGQPGNCNSNGE